MKGGTAERLNGRTAERRNGGMAEWVGRMKGRTEINMFNSITKVMENNYHSFEDLLIWQEGMKLCDEIYLSLIHI